MRNDQNMCDSIGCFRQAIYIREEERLRYPEQLCAACYSRKIAEMPKDASQYRSITGQTSSPAGVNGHSVQYGTHLT